MICHASIDENGQTTGTTPGDQTTKEVCTRTYYNKPWNYMIRCTDPQMREKIAYAMERAANNDNIGYSQPHRNDLLKSCRSYKYDPGFAKKPCDCDCSSLVSVACMYAGIPESALYSGNNCCTTSNIRSRLMATGKFQTFTDTKYFNNDDYLYRGDILLKEPGHVAVNITNGKNANNTISNIKAIDVSKYNVITNYSQLAKEIQYIIIRVGYRAYSNGKITEDPAFENHITNAIANNMKVGVYFYDQSINEKEAIEQADWVANKISKYKIDLPVYIDSEAISGNKGRADSLSPQQRTNNVVAFCNRIAERNYTPGVYAGNSWFKNQIIFDKIKNYNIWCARYSTNKPDIPKYDAWQYGSEYYSWATDKIDSNIFYNFNSTNNPVPVPSYTETPILIMGKVTASTLNIRSIPSTNGNIIGTLKKNSEVNLIAKTDNNWYKLKEGGYVSGSYINYLQAKVVNCNKLNVRSSPSADNNNNIIKSVPVNTVALVMSKSNGWYQLIFNDNMMGWCSGKYIAEI